MFGGGRMGGDYGDEDEDAHESEEEQYMELVPEDAPNNERARFLQVGGVGGWGGLRLPRVRPRPLFPWPPKPLSTGPQRELADAEEYEREQEEFFTDTTKPKPPKVRRR